MLIRLQDYQEGELIPVHETYDPKKMDVEFVDLHYAEPLELEGTVEKGPDILTFRGHLSSKTELLCGRCLKQIPSTLEKDFEYFYEITGKESIDTTDDLRETLILEHGLAFVCSENCRGLCPSCGKNLNEGKCQCQTQSGENNLSKLKDLWNKRKQESDNG